MVTVEDVVHFVLTTFKVLLLTIIGTVKAFLPMGVLPRKSIQGETVLITGTGSGIGRLMAVEFAKLGATLVLWELNEKANLETKALVEKQGGKAFAYTVDVSKSQEINAAAEKVKKEVGEVDILINNAGIVTGKKIFECPDELMEKTMAVNTNALLFTAKNFVKSMIQRNHGHLVTIASICGRAGSPGLVDYCASKYGAIGFHESLSAELKRAGADGVKTTVVCPWLIETGMFSGVQCKSPTVLPPLKPEYVVECILEAVLTNKEEIQVPRFLYVCTAAGSLLPTDAKMAVMEYLGIFEAMDTFTGRSHAKK